MNFGGTTFVLAIIALSIGGWMFTTWIRAKHGYPVENEWGGTVHRTDPDADRKIALLTDDNAKLAGQVSRLEERISVLERIATEEGGKAAQYAAHTERLEARVRVLERIVTDKGIDVADEIEKLRDAPLN